MENIMDSLKDYLPHLLDQLWKVMFALVFFFVGRKLIKLFVDWVNSTMKRTGFDPTAQKFLSSLVNIILLGILIYILADFVGVPTASLLALIGSAGLAIGLALQGSLANFAGGVLLLALKPFTAGDYIIDSAHNIDGTVEAIDIFYTRLITPDNKSVFIPNGVLANATITNFSAQNKRRLDFFINIGYDSDVAKAKKVITDMINNRDTVISKEDTIAFVERLAESCVVLGVRCWIPTTYFLAEKWAIAEEIKLVLEKNNIPIAIPKMNVQLAPDKERNDA